jgi:predicted dehydrogenase
MKKMNLAILGTGNIAAQMADTVSRMNNVVLYACAFGIFLKI